MTRLLKHLNLAVNIWGNWERRKIWRETAGSNDEGGRLSFLSVYSTDVFSSLK